MRNALEMRFATSGGRTTVGLSDRRSRSRTSASAAATFTGWV